MIENEKKEFEQSEEKAQEKDGESLFLAYVESLIDMKYDF